MVDEIILAEEQGAARKVGSIRRRTGTLVLTNLRIVFVSARDILYKGTDMVGTNGGFLDIQAVGFSEIYSVDDISKFLDAPLSDSRNQNVSIPLGYIKSAVEHKSRVGATYSLQLRWQAEYESSEANEATFLEEMTGKRSKNLNDWAEVILKLKSGELAHIVNEEILKEKSKPAIETLEGKVLYILGDLQSKSSLQIESELRRKFEGSVASDLEPDKIEDACLKLINENWILSIREGKMPVAYRKLPPLGADFDLSS